MSIAVVGFDVGCTSSYVAVAKQGGIETIANEYSDRNTPTFVSFSNNRRLVGVDAKMQQVTNISNTIFNFTPLMGKLFSDFAIKKERELLPYSTSEGADGRVRITERQQSFLPEQIYAMQLTKLRQIAEVNLGMKVTDVVINVPVHCTDSERRAVLDASRIAGLNCVKLVTDISAIGTAYGLYNQDFPDIGKPPRLITFVTVGYASTQVGICAFNSGKMTVLATCCDPQLGGRDFDFSIYSKFARDFEEKHKLKLSDSAKAVFKVLRECEKLKKNMSANTQDLSLDVECVMNDKDLCGKMNRAEFETLCSPLVKRFENVLRRCLSLGKCDPKDIHSVEIVGGCSRIPILKTTIAAVFNKEPRTTLNADEAVARGCALQAAIYSPAYKVRDFQVTDACPYPIGLFWRNEDCNDVIPSPINESETGISNESGETFVEVFPLFHSIPSSRLFTFKRRGPFSLEARYLNSAELPNNNVVIGTFSVNEIPVKGSEESKVRVKVRMNAHGIFSICKAEIAEEYQKEVEVEPSTNSMDTSEKQSNEIPVNGDASKEQCPSECDAQDADTAEKVAQTQPKETITKTFIRYKDLPIDASVMQLLAPTISEFCEAEFKMVQQEELVQKQAHAKNAVEEYVYEMRSKLQEPLFNFATANERTAFQAELEATEDWLYGEGENLSRQEYVDKLQDLKKTGDRIVMRFNESINRVTAISNFERSIVEFRKVLDYAAKKNDDYAHLNEEQLTQIQNALHKEETWLRSQMHAQSALPLHADPVLLTEQIVAQHQVLESTCRPIANTPKPVQPPPPLPESGEANNNNNGVKNDLEENASPVKKNVGANHDSVKADTMDVD